MIDLFDFDALRHIGLTLPIVQQLMQQPPAPGQRPMRVTALHRDAVLSLHDGHREWPARTRPALVQDLQADDDMLAVGDWVLAECDPQGAWWARARVAPHNQLTRRISDGNGGLRRQALVSNVDLALLLMGLDHDWSPRRLERYLALAHLARLDVLLVLTKADTCAPHLRDQRLAEAQALLPDPAVALALDGRDDAAREALSGWLSPGRTLVLLGSSGAGKSTLTNTLLGHGRQATGPVRAGDDRGRHTTTARTLYTTPSGACIIDTPGLRALRLDSNDDAELLSAFDDIQRAALHCRFRDCRHQDEPGCRVREQVAPERVRNYQKLQREAQRDRLTLQERRAQLQAWKARSRAGRNRAHDKRREA